MHLHPNFLFHLTTIKPCPSFFILESLRSLGFLLGFFLCFWKNFGGLPFFCPSFGCMWASRPYLTFCLLLSLTPMSERPLHGAYDPQISRFHLGPFALEQDTGPWLPSGCFHWRKSQQISHSRRESVSPVSYWSKVESRASSSVSPVHLNSFMFIDSV